MAAEDGAERMNVRRVDLVLLLILLGALIVRVQLATTREYIHDENNTAIPLSKTISFDPGNLHLPLRGENHPALPAYVVKVSSVLFGTTMLGYRLMHVLLGLVTIVLAYRISHQRYGPAAARWAAALLAFNEYYLNVSSRATAHVPNLLLVTTAVYAFSRFLATDRAIYLYGAGAAAGLAF
jgi:4-amino-4-deoxy-L-arabinose transferase-like glycosyltransferase